LPVEELLAVCGEAERRNAFDQLLDLAGLELEALNVLGRRALDWKDARGLEQEQRSFLPRGQGQVVRSRDGQGEGALSDAVEVDQ
jgi:hypothetical protein